MLSLQRRVISAALLVPALVLPLAACGGGSADADATPVVNQGVYTSKLPLDLPVIVAQDRGYFDDEGITVETTDIQTGTDMVTAIISGSIDVGNPATPPAITVLTQQGADVGALAGGPALDFRVLVPADADVPSGSMADRLSVLKGTTVSVIGSGTLTDWWFRDALEQAGLSDKDVQIVAANNVPSQIAAFQEGKVDAMVAFGTVPGLLGTEGTDYQVLLGIPEGDTGDTYDGYLQTFTAASHKWQDGHEDAVGKYCAAVAKAVDWLEDDANHDEAVQAMADWTQLDEAKAEALLESTDYEMKLTPKSWAAQGDTVGEASSLDFDKDVNGTCNDQFSE